MNRFLKILSLSAALLIGATLFAGCRDEKDISEKLDWVFEGCDKIPNVESGEIFIYKTVKPEKDIENVLLDSTEETFIVFTNDTGDLDFRLTRDYRATNSDYASKYEFAKEGDVMVEFFDGVGDYTESAPDIYEEFKLRFTAADVNKIEVTSKEKGFKEYKFYMKEAYANGFDSEADGLKKDCTGVTYYYYVDNYANLSTILREYVYKVTYEGETQKLVEFIDIKID